MLLCPYGLIVENLNVWLFCLPRWLASAFLEVRSFFLFYLYYMYLYACSLHS